MRIKGEGAARWLAVLAVLVAAGCAKGEPGGGGDDDDDDDDDDIVLADGGIDAGPGPIDAGAPPIDATELSLDAPAPPIDAAELPPDAPPAPITTTITRSTDTTTITTPNAISCNATGVHSENSYWRVFALADFGITSTFTISNVQIGIEQAIAGTGVSQPAELKLHTLNGAFTNANLSQLSTQAVTISNQSGTLLNIPVASVVVPAGGTFVVQVRTPDGAAAGHSFFFGSNSAGQSSPSYISAPLPEPGGCAITEPTDLASIDFPAVHWVMSVTGTYLD
jgi:hypothetical protein